MGVHMSSPDLSKQVTATGLSSRLHYVAMGIPGWRPEMEDTHLVYKDELNDTYIFGVFDGHGHGGKEMARFFSKHFTRELLASNDFLQKNFCVALSETFFRMDELLVDPCFAHELQWLKLDPGEAPDELFEDPSHAGCTAIVALIVGDMLYLASAGDSRCILSDATGFSVPFIEHKPDNQQEKARILKAGGCVRKRRVCGNLNLSRAIGNFEFKTPGLRREQQMITAMPDVVVREIGDLEFLLLGSDGMWESKDRHGRAFPRHQGEVIFEETGPGIGFGGSAG